MSILGDWKLYALSAYSTLTALSTNSTLSMCGTTIGAYNVRVGGSSGINVLLTYLSPITLSNSSTLSIYGITIEAYNVSVVGDWFVLVLSLSTSITLSDRRGLHLCCGRVADR